MRHGLYATFHASARIISDEPLNVGELREKCQN